MPAEPTTVPVVLCFSGHDPSGGAGIQADIEALASHGCFATTAITTLTVQDSHNVHEFSALPAEFVLKQARAVLADMPVEAFKIGMLGSADNARAIAGLLAEYPKLPVVLDPVLAAGGGTRVDSEELIAVIREQLLPRTTICTPNGEEARRLTGKTALEDCAKELIQLGCGYVLITGGHEATPAVLNTLYSSQDKPDTFSYTRLPALYHGSGCTLAASIAGLMALKLPIEQVVSEAMNYTWESLANGYVLGEGQHYPNRFFWFGDEDVEEEDWSGEGY
ncbi:MAG: hydroxymethylpyrimidine/phosphomethylpyrimidine kinase [Gammaproteobacteria bacterium]|nr:hydroxymethylpyrimidine/phosphomethylpyrimidine kinase [Gammaproteobacteria bacterium]